MSNSNPEQQFEHDNDQQQTQIKSTIPSFSSSLTQSPLQQQSVSEIKLELVQLNQQLLTVLLSNPNSNNQHQLQLLQLTQQLQLQCDNFSTIELDFKQQEIESELYFSQQQKIIDQQQLELKQSQIDFELKMLERESKYEQKSIDFEQHVKSKELDFQRREFELTMNKRQSTSNTSGIVTNQDQQESINQQNIKSNYDDHVDFTNPTQLHTTSTITPNDQQNSSNEAILQAFHDLHQDYQAMKYLVEQSILSNQTLDQSCTLLLQQQHQNQQPTSSIQQQQQQQADSLQTQSQLNEILEILSSHLPKVDLLQTQMGNVDQYLQTLQGNLTRLHTRLVPLELAAKSTTTTSTPSTTPTPTTSTTSTTSTPTTPATNQPISSSTTSTTVSTKPVTASSSTTTKPTTTPSTTTPSTTTKPTTTPSTPTTTTTPATNPKSQPIPPVSAAVINAALTANHNSHASNPPSMLISFHFANFPGVYQSCHKTCPTKTLFEVFYPCLVDQWLKGDLFHHKTAIQASKLYMSSQSVANGQWIQIQGQGSLIDMTKLKLKHFLKSGDDVHSCQSYPCSVNCKFCIDGKTGRDKTLKRFIITFKWE